MSESMKDFDERMIKYYTWLMVVIVCIVIGLILEFIRRFIL